MEPASAAASTPPQSPAPEPPAAENTTPAAAEPAVADQQGAPEQQRAAGQSDAVEQRRAAGQSDAVEQRRAAGQQDSARQQDSAGQDDAVEQLGGTGQEVVAGQQDRAGHADAAQQPDAAGQEGAAEQQEGAAEQQEVEASASPRLSKREGRSPRDMVLSLAVLIVPIALLLIFYRVVLSGDAPVTVDPASTIQEAQQAKLFTIAVPTGLGDDWHATSATFTRQASGATLRIGYADPDKDPVQLVESNVPSATLLPSELTTKAKPVSNFRAENGVWRLYDGRPGEQALVLADENRTIIVVGKTDVKNLESLAASLK